MSSNERSPQEGGGGGGGGNWRRKRRRRGRGGRNNSGGGGGGGNAVQIPEIEGEIEEVSGVLDLHKDGSGFLRQARHSYMADEYGHDDIAVPAALVRQHRMMEGSEIHGSGGIPKKGFAKRLTISEVATIDGMTPDESKERRLFKELTVVDPEPMLSLATQDDADVSLRIVDLLCPIGRGQRGLIVAPPRSGKTVLMQKICHALAENYPDLYMIILLIDERPEEATGWRRSVEGENREVLVSTLDEGPKHHIKIAEMALKRAQRMVEGGRDVVILLDSITRLTRAYNSDMGGRGGHTMSGGIGAKVLEHPKKFFGAARNCEEGGSLTILATTLVDTGSRMDQVIFEEFKGTGNMELVLNRQLAERRVFPAIDIEMSGTRKEELLLPESVINSIYTLRRVLARMSPLDSMPLLIDRLEKTSTNTEFLNSFRVDD